MLSTGRVLSALTILALIGTASVVKAQNFKAPGESPFTVVSALMAIKSPASNACPAQAKMVGWITTNKPGTVVYMIARKGGNVDGPYQVKSVPSAKGAMATFKRDMTIETAIDAEYRILVADGTGKVISNWAPLKASCKIKLGG